jgi:DNA-binding NtrC family response regulator
MIMNARILIADDDPAVLQVMDRALSRACYRCTTVTGASEAVEALRNARYDLLISDIHMPGNHHLELIRQVSRIAEGMPVILLTGYPSLETAIDALHLPVVEYLIKPVHVADLLNRVSDVLERAGLLHTLELARRHGGILPEEIQRVLRSVAAARHSGTEGVEPLPANRAAGGDMLLERQRHLITETVTVLKATKTAFKSKELGLLRKKLETFLKDYP